MTMLLAPTVFAAATPTASIDALVGNVGGQVLDAAVGLAPVAVPFVLSLAAIGWVMRKFGLAGAASLSGPGRGPVVGAGRHSPCFCADCDGVTPDGWNGRHHRGCYCTRCEPDEEYS